MSRFAKPGRALRTGAALVVLGALVAGCNSSNDDGGGTDGGGTDGPPPGSNPAGPMMPGGMSGALESSDSFADIAARGPTDEPYELGDGLGADLESGFGGTGADPVDVEDGEGIDAVVPRRTSPAR